jgi:diacylglycerol kinase
MMTIFAIVASIVFVDPTFAYITLAIIVAGVILMWLMVKSSDEYTVEQTEEDSEDFAGEIRDSHGPVTRWLWVAYVVIFVWAIAYLIQHSAEFPRLI